MAIVEQGFLGNYDDVYKVLYTLISKKKLSMCPSNYKLVDVSYPLGFVVKANHPKHAPSS